MNRIIYFKTEEPLASWKHLGMVLILLSLFAGSMAFGQSANPVSVGTTNPEAAGSAAKEQYLSTISVIVAILAALTTIVILVTGITALNQIHYVGKERERFRKAADEAEGRIVEINRKIAEIDNRVKGYRSPEAILNDAAEKAEKITVDYVEPLRVSLSESEESLEKRLDELKSGVIREKALLDQLTTTVNAIKVELDSKPSTNDILAKVADKYKVAEDLMEIVLQKVGLAFVCLRNLSEEESKEIMKRLSVNPKKSVAKRD